MPLFEIQVIICLRGLEIILEAYLYGRPGAHWITQYISKWESPQAAYLAVLRNMNPYQLPSL